MTEVAELLGLSPRVDAASPRSAWTGRPRRSGFRHKRFLRPWQVTASFVLAVAFMCVPLSSAQATFTPYQPDPIVRHGCQVVGSAAGGFEAINCADIYQYDHDYYYAGGQAFCRRVSDRVLVQCSGVQQRIELWNYTKNTLASSETYECGYFIEYFRRCSEPGGWEWNGRNYFWSFNSLVIRGCDQAYVVVRTTVRLPGTNTIRTGIAYTTNFQRPSC